MSRLPIHGAAINGDVDALRKELETSAPDVECPNGIVPLHYLVAYAAYATNRHDTDNRVACIHLLAAAGANMSLLTIHNTTAIMYAARGGNPTVLAALLDAGSEVNHR